MRKGDWQEDLRTVAERADVVIIDEAHNFRNTGTKGSDPEERQSRYWRLFDLIQDKTVFMLTATPVNNQLTDLLHMIELFSRQRQNYFSRLGIHNLQAHFRQMERQIDRAIRDTTTDEGAPAEVNALDAERVLGSDALFQELVVQRSRSYVRKSVAQEEGSNVLFPNPKEPKVQPYSVKQTTASSWTCWKMLLRSMTHCSRWRYTPRWPTTRARTPTRSQPSIEAVRSRWFA